MTSDSILNHEALSLLLDAETRPARWRSRAHLASECGVDPASLSLAASGKRGLSTTTFDALIGCTGWPRGALLLPVKARSGDLETQRLTVELKRLREDVARRTDEIAEAIRQRGA